MLLRVCLNHIKQHHPGLEHSPDDVLQHKRMQTQGEFSNIHFANATCFRMTNSELQTEK